MNTKLSINTLLATFFGIGHVPFAPGTFGSFAAFAIYLILPASLYAGAWSFLFPVAILLLALISVRICYKAEFVLGEDASAIVLDEIWGYFIATLFLPHNWLIGLYAFLLFGVFDIAKPFPIYRSQKLKKGWGVVVDDLLAGIYANIILQILIRIYPKFFGI
ncbi:MAG: phosphatidylglycerophosphatase A [Candidatus Cloacimonetes bacterium]|nr:phosphatidylglycerophosphatase A [Candidatus Cloacimonadota bacterium]